VSGPVFRPVRSRSTCSLAQPHKDDAEQPPAAYLLFVDACLSRPCAGGLWCLGHAVCIKCGMGIREGRLIYTRHDETPQVQAVTSR
jgi:hypothetical protein